MPVPESATDTSIADSPANAVWIHILPLTGSAVLHGIHSVHRQIQHDLLQVDLVGAHRARGLRLRGLERDAPFQCLRAKNVERIANASLRSNSCNSISSLFFNKPRRWLMMSAAR